jgi:hypothetical protein
MRLEVIEATEDLSVPLVVLIHLVVAEAFLHLRGARQRSLV